MRDSTQRNGAVVEGSTAIAGLWRWRGDDDGRVVRERHETGVQGRRVGGAHPRQSHCSARLGGHRNLGLQGQAPGRPPDARVLIVPVIGGSGCEAPLRTTTSVAKDWERQQHGRPTAPDRPHLPSNEHEGATVVLTVSKYRIVLEDRLINLGCERSPCAGSSPQRRLARAGGAAPSSRPPTSRAATQLTTSSCFRSLT